MRFLVMVKGNKDYEPARCRRAGAGGDGKFNDELVKAGVMLAARGCSLSEGARSAMPQQADGA